jgi:hypothetical protein
VSLVQSEDVLGTIPFGEHDVRGICYTNVPEAGVTFYYLHRLRDILGRDLFQAIHSACDFAE